MLFGGGLTLAAAIETNGVAEFIGNSTRPLGGLPPSCCCWRLPP